MTGRARSATAIGRILRGGAYSNVLLGRPTADGDIDEHRFVQGLTMHALRTVGLADTVLERFSTRSPAKLDPVVVDVIRIAVAELDRGGTPPAVAVSEAVETAKLLGFGRAAGFVNALLRSLVRDGLPELGIVARLGVPPWLADALREEWGEEEAERFWLASSKPSRVGLWGQPPTGSDVTAVPGLPGSFLADQPVPGMLVIDPASAAVARAVAVRPGDLVLDLAAAPGGKTAILVTEAGGGRVIAGDLHERRVRSARRRVGGAAWLRLDATRPPFANHTFDRVLLDAPCTGLGSLRRRPEILQRVTEAESGRLVRIQGRALEAALRVVKPGGRIVYSVCTVLPSETSAQVERFGAVPPSGCEVGRREGSGWLLAPHLGPTDGMFISLVG